MLEQPAGCQVARDIHHGDQRGDDGGRRGRETEAVDLQGGQEAHHGEPAARIGAEAERDGERPAAAGDFHHLVEHRPALHQLPGRASGAGQGAQQQGGEHVKAQEAAAATSQTARHDVPGRMMAAISIIEPAPAGM